MSDPTPQPSADYDALYALAVSWEDEAKAGRAGNGHPLLVQTYEWHALELRAVLARVIPPVVPADGGA